MLTNANLFFEAVVHTTHRLCGLKLKPLCLLHLLWLEQINSPLLPADRPVSMRDLELAAAICSSGSSEEITKKLKSPAYVWHWRNNFRSTAQEARAWTVYFSDFFSLPDFMGDDKSSEPKLPWLSLCLSAVVRQTGWEVERVLTMPVGLVVWLNLNFSFLESGQTAVASDKERQAMALLRDMGAGR